MIQKLYAQLLCCKTLSETERVALVQKTLDFIDQFDITSDEAFFGVGLLVNCFSKLLLIRSD
jgi:hypothetical protein